MFELYQQILNLRKSKKRTERGYQFEQLIREIQPWEFKPPVVVSPKSEQLDGVYTRHGITFIIESKAKAKKITQGDPDWEDFELKIRRRHGNGIIGIYCSLFNVHDSVFEAGDRMNKEGLFNFILAGDTWDQLVESQLDFGNLIDYMVQYVRTKNSSKPPLIQNIFKWVFDKEDVNKELISFCQKESGLFLRRFKHNHHELLYVKRNIDNNIQQIVNQLKPNNLRNKQVGYKEIPKQFLIVRDLSGSGKTTMSVELSLTHYDYIVIGMSANGQSIDSKIENFFNHFKNNCFNELKTINSPIVFVIDSLDEVSNTREKKREIKSVFEKVEQLNKFATSLRYVCFPILIVYTIRDDFYREWESDFEGRHEIFEKRKVITSFSNEEFAFALKNYSEVYKYKIVNPISEESKEILSIPINIEIFSDANEYEGDIYITEIWEGKILQSYFERKIDDITKHLFQGISSEVYLSILARLALYIVESKQITFNTIDFKKLITLEFSNWQACSDKIFNLFESEQILVRDIEHKSNYRFRYLRFVEYLIAQYAVSYINLNNSVSYLDDFTQKVFDSGFLSMFRVFDNIKHITKDQFPTLKNDIENHFNKSEAFMSKKLPIIRSTIANGKVTTKEDLKLIFDNTFSNNPQLTWDAFFVVAAKLNQLPIKTIIDTFVLSWNTNSGNPNRWKLLTGLAKNDLLLNEIVIKTIVASEIPKEWEIYLGYIFENNLSNYFEDNDLSKLFDNKINGLLQKKSSDWNYICRLFTAIKSQEKYVPGRILSESLPGNFSIRLSSNSQIEISEEKKIECITIIDEIENVYFKKIKAVANVHNLSSWWDNDLIFFNNEFNKRFNKPFGKEKKPFLNYIIANCTNFSSLISLICENPHIDCNVLGFDINKVTLFQEIYKSDFYLKHLVFEYLVQKRYPKRKMDDDFILNERKAKPNNEWVYLSEFYYSVSDIKIAKKIWSNQRIICTILSFKFKNVIGFRFNNLIQVANNALSNYYQYYHMIEKAINKYKLHDELSSKPSFIKKEKELALKTINYDNSSDDMFITLFPELFEN